MSQVMANWPQQRRRYHLCETKLKKGAWGGRSGETDGNGDILLGPFLCLWKNSMSADMKKNLSVYSQSPMYSFAVSVRVQCRKQKGCNAGNLLLGESLEELEGWALGQASENDFQDTLEELAMGIATSATVRKVAIRRLPLKPRQENTAVAVIKGITAATAVAIITAWSLKFSIWPLLWQLLLDAYELVIRCRNDQSGTTASATVPQHPRSWRLETDMSVTFFASWEQLKATGWQGSASLLSSVFCVLHLKGRIKFSSWIRAVKEPGKYSFQFPNHFRKAFCKVVDAQCVLLNIVC